MSFRGFITVTAKEKLEQVASATPLNSAEKDLINTCKKILFMCKNTTNDPDGYVYKDFLSKLEGTEIFERLYERAITEENEKRMMETHKQENKEKNTNWGWKILAALIFLPIVILVLLTIVSAFVDVWGLSDNSIGLFLINLVAIPLAIIGGFKVVKGLFLVSNEAIEKHNIIKDWQLSTYVAITMIEVIALVYVFLKL